MFRMTKQADNGAFLLSLFAKHADGAILTARDLAEKSQLPLPTVTKILKILARGGVLISHRGVHGGYSLARNPAEITLKQIVAALEGPVAITQCCDNAPGCHRSRDCTVSPNWRRIDSALRSALANVTLRELTGTELTGTGITGAGDNPSDLDRVQEAISTATHTEARHPKEKNHDS